METAGTASDPIMDGMDRPEIEDGLAAAAYLCCLENIRCSGTSIDVLEVPKDPASAVYWHQGLDHTALLEHFEPAPEVVGGPDNLSLRILFLNARPTSRGNCIVSAHPSTLEWLQVRFGISTVFLECLVDMSWGAKPGNACFTKRDRKGSMIQIDALYHFQARDTYCHIWFSYHCLHELTTYVIFRCPPRAKDRILKWALTRDPQTLLRPTTVDAFIVDACAWGFKAEIQELRGWLIRYESHGASPIPLEPIQNTFASLHDLSQSWHVLHENLIDLGEALDFVLSIHKNHINASASTSAYESIEFIASRNHIWKRWAANYNTRTKIRIDLFFNLASQSDNRINIEIAETSKTIAEDTRKDSSSMITIAAMTMLFLPGTFVSAIFSMTFFSNAGTDKSGNATLSVLPQWWYFPVATIPLTILVFGSWILWQRQRQNSKNQPSTKGLASIRDQAHRLKRLFNQKKGMREMDTST